MQGFTYIDLAVLIVYLLAVLFAGLYFAKKEMKGKEYFKGDGTVPWWVTSVSIFATLLSPISFLSLAGNSYAGSWLLWFAQLGMLLAARAQGRELALPPLECALGALLNHLRTPVKHFQPSNAHFGLMPELDEKAKKKDRKALYSARARERFAAWRAEQGL